MFDFEEQKYRRGEDVKKFLSDIKGPPAMKAQDVPLCAELLTKLDHTRAKMKQTLLDDIEKLVVVAEYDKEKERHNKRKPRHDGTPYFEGHLVPVTMLGIEEQSLVQVDDVITLLKHDTIEDIDRKGIEPIERRTLLRTERYIHKIPANRLGWLHQLKTSCWRMVTGLTKTKMNTEEETERGTFENSLFLIGSNGEIRILMHKNADRRHNMSTIDGHKQPEKRAKIARETKKVHIPWAGILETRLTEEGLILDTLRVLKPSVHKTYTDLQERKKREFLDPYHDAILERLRHGNQYLPGIEEVEFAPTEVRRIINCQKKAAVKPFDELMDSDVHLDDRDPGFVTTIITTEKEDISRIRDVVVEKFSDSRTQVEIKPLNNRGIFIRVFNKAFGGMMMFRINDMVSETFSKQGILASTSKAELADLRKTAAEIAAKGSDPEVDIFDMANQELLKRNMVVYTMDNDPIKLKRGSTGLDFARRIDPDILIGAQKCYISDDIWGRNKREISLFNELPAECYVFIDSCLSEKGDKKKAPEKIKIDPSWLFFADQKTSDAIKTYLKQLPSEESEQKGRDWAEHFCRLFNLEESTFADDLATEEMKQGHEFYKKIGKGEIDLTEKIEKSNRWTVTVILDNKPGEKKKFMENIFSEKINIESDQTTQGDNGKSILRFEVSFTSANMLTRDFFKAVIKAAYDGYQVTVSPSK